MPDRQKAAPVTASVVHALPGRVRLRFAGMAAPDLVALSQRIAALPGVAAARADTRTGSLLIRGEAVDKDAVAQMSGLAGIRVAGSDRPRTPVDVLLDRFDAADDRLLRATGGQIDIPSLAVLALLGSAVVQMVRGQFGAPAITILWYAASTVLMARALRGNGSSSPQAAPQHDGGENGRKDEGH